MTNRQALYGITLGTASIIAIISFMATRASRYKTLVAVCCIDERSHELDECLRCIKSAQQSADILGIIRTGDTICQDVLTGFGAFIHNVIPYPTPGRERHNFEALTLKRNHALKHARDNGYDVMVFVDSDIRVDPKAFAYIRWGILMGFDVICIPYPVRWAGGHAVLGYNNPARIERLSCRKRWWPFHKFAVGGMGCTAINIHSPRIPDMFTIGTIMGVRGEDIGFFLEANKKGANMFATSWHKVDHEIKGEVIPDYLNGHDWKSETVNISSG